MKKVFDQTVRDIKREVNKKVLKVPGIEQKVLDATSNEPWGPHGTLLADIAQATRNYHEYQMIMAVIWKRINDTGKNWRHVYKGLTVLEYLVANGSERVIDEIREHAYQISTLSDFQYIDSSGRDQGSNVRKKSQSLVVLVNDKERIIEVRQKAAANREKFRNTSAGGMYKPGSYGDRYDDERYEGRYGSRDEDRNGYGYGRERDYNYRDDDRYGKYGDSYSRDGDRYGRDNEERYSRDGYRDDDYQGRSRSIDDYGSRSRSSDRGADDDGQSSSRGSGAKADDQSQDGSIARRLERKFSEQNIAPPSYEEAVSESRSPAHSERNGETSAASVPGVSSPPAPRAASPAESNIPSQAATGFGTTMSSAGEEVEVADEFDPRCPGSASPTTAAASAAATVSSNAEMDLLGSLSDSFAANPLAIMPVSAVATSEVDTQTNFPGSTFSATQPPSSVMNMPFEDPFGDSPFKAIPSTSGTMSAQQHTSTSGAALQPTLSQSAEIPPTVPQDTVNNFGFGDTFSGLTYSAPNAQPTSANSQFLPQELSTSHDETDILADILPTTGPSPVVATQAGFPALAGQPAEPGANIYGNYNLQAGSVAPVSPNMGPQTAQFSSGNFLPHGGSTAPISSAVAPQTPAGPGTQFNNGNLLPQQVSAAPASQFHGANFLPTQGSVPAAQYTATGPNPQFSNGSFLPQQGSTAPVVMQAAHHFATAPTPHFNNGNFMPQQGSVAPVPQVGYQTPTGSATQPNNDVLGNLFTQGPKTSSTSQPGIPSSAGPLALVPQPSKEKFETKSTVWADTLSRGLVNLNISGPKINPLSDIGIDFDAINRKEKRMEKPTTAPATSTINMGKAMGSGSGIGRAGASGLRVPPNPMMNSGMGMGAGMNNMGMGMGGGPGSGMAMGGYGGMNQPMAMQMGMGMGMNMGMNVGMGQGGQMQPPGSTMPGGYNPMMGTGGYTQQPYGGGYR
ncbi:clathrin interactor EPSIN 3 isoform X1 [Ricinus communis]|uniref:clathrin interactor EPSIN 3 isoform X1 n=1 Tax=Ricinus communis TaxID=3988 RepID=UPI00201AB387|nr:clathrin interactor EPSIN 3 isoform X1 [Ricinus communis]XP_015583027.2 clathrin interactor EPSIN 3 isoform X1 [Ricinus communis]